MHPTMRACLLVATYAAALTAGGARAADDPLASPGCRNALEALQAAEDALASQHAPRDATPADPRLLAARREAARACLATRADATAPPAVQVPPGRLAQPPIAVAPVGITAAPIATPRAPTPTPAPVGRPPARPQAIVACDAGGCWANDGTHLDRFGPALSAGSRGLCTLQGALLTCP